MKKMMMVLVMVFGLSAVFADSYVAFTSQNIIEDYENNEEDKALFNAKVKSEFESGANFEGLSKQQRKAYTYIVVINDTDLLYRIVVHTTDSKVFGIVIADADSNPIGYYHYEASSKTAPVLVGLNFIKEIVLQVNNIDKNKVVFTAFEAQEQDLDQ